MAEKKTRLEPPDRDAASALAVRERARDDAATVIFSEDELGYDIQEAPIARQQDGTTPLGRPTAFGPYEVVDLLGQGGMGVVYKGRGPRDEIVAIKVMSPEHAAKSHLVRRFLREFKICEMLDHPNIARAMGA